VLLAVLGLVLGAALGGLAVRRFWPRYIVDIEEVQVPLEPPKALRRFQVIFATDAGGDARRLWEKVKPQGDAVMEFWDGDARRGVKEPS